MIIIEAAYFYDSEDTSSTDSGDFDSGSAPAASGDGMEGSSDKKNRMKSVQIREIKITGQFQTTFTLRYVLFLILFLKLTVLPGELEKSSHF